VKNWLQSLLLSAGQRVPLRPGEPSAYSVFNNFEELPGTYNAANVDDQLRHRNQE
jgi:hypothetical protein